MPAITPAPPPEDNESLRAILGAALLERDQHKQRADALEMDLLRLQQQLDWYKKRYYGPRADQLRSQAELAQMLLQFAEELERKPVNPDDVGVVSCPEAASELRRVKKRPGRRNLANYDALPVRTIVHELGPQERACPGCGAERAEMGQQESWQLEYVPGYLERLQHLRKKYVCAGCEKSGESPEIASAAKPDAVVEKGMAGPGLLAHIVTSKFSDYLPLYRLEDIFGRIGCEVSRATMSVWCGDVADLVEPLYELMAAQVRHSHVVGTDDTTKPMLDPGAGHTRSARMWIYRGDDSQPYNLFHFTLSRRRDGPLEFLKDYKQVLVADGYGGYNAVVAGNQITRAGCMAHVRRKFVDAEKSAPAIAAEAVALVRQLYKIEAQAAGATAEVRLEVRREQSVPVLEQLRAQMLRWKRELLPKHPMAEAVGYALNQWDELNVFTRDGGVPIDNNASEREMKRVVLNRKNSLFVGNPRGGRTAAILASLTSTCRRHEINPQLYLTQLLVNLPAWPMRDLAAWLPDAWKRRQAELAPPPSALAPSVS